MPTPLLAPVVCENGIWTYAAPPVVNFFTLFEAARLTAYTYLMQRQSS